MFKPTAFAAACLLAAGMSSAHAAPVTFSATGIPGVSGAVTFDFTPDGSSYQPISNSTITALSLNVFGQLFDLSDVVTSGISYFNSTGLPILLIGAGGYLADNGVRALAIFPENLHASGNDGDAWLGIGPTGDSFAFTNFYNVQWVAGNVNSTVPEPASLALVGLALAGLANARRRKNH